MPTNLLTNPDAETGDLTGWTTDDGMIARQIYDLSSVPRPTDDAGDWGFCGMGRTNTTGQSSATQTVDVSSEATAIDAGEKQAVLSGYLGGWSNQADYAYVTAEFLDSDGEALGDEMQIGPVTMEDRSSTSAMLLRTATADVPNGTRSIRVTMTSVKSDATGTNNDGYIDLLSLLVQDPPVTPENPTPLGLWRFDGDFTDSSGNGYDLSSSGSTTDGLRDSALNLNGSTGDAATYSGGVLDTSKSFTVCCWASFTYSSEHNTFVSQSGDNVSAFFLKIHRVSNQNFAEFTIFTADSTDSIGADITSEVTIPRNAANWAHLAGVYDQENQEIRLYLNGRLVASAAATTPPFNATTEFAVGRATFGGGPVDVPTGKVDDVCVFQAALSAEEIRTVKNNWTEPDAIPAWSGEYLLNGDGSDSSGNGKDLSMASSATFGTGFNGQGLASDGGSDEYGITSGAVIDTTQSYTVMGWVEHNGDGADDYQAIASQRAQHVSAFFLQPKSAGSLKPRFAITQTDSTSTNQPNVIATDEIPSGVFTHLCGVVDTSTSKAMLYINGTLAGSVSFAGLLDATVGFSVNDGWWDDQFQNRLDGTSDEIRAVQAALSMEQIHDAMNNWTPPAPTIAPAFFIIQNTARMLAGGGL